MHAFQSNISPGPGIWAGAERGAPLPVNAAILHQPHAHCFVLHATHAGRPITNLMYLKRRHFKRTHESLLNRWSSNFFSDHRKFHNKRSNLQLALAVPWALPTKEKRDFYFFKFSLPTAVGCGRIMHYF